MAFAAAAVLLLSTEMGLRLGAASWWRDPSHVEAESRALMKDRLRALDGMPGKRVLLLGDSVFYGSALRHRGVKNWREEKVAAHLGRILGPGWKVMDFGADGLYPLDLEALLDA